MRRATLAFLVTLACLSLAAPASAQQPAPDPDATIDVSTTCDPYGDPDFVVQVRGLNVNEQKGLMVTDAGGTARVTIVDMFPTDANGGFWTEFAAPFEPGTYTIYAYTGPYQNLGPADWWPGSIHMETFDPSLTTSWVSKDVEVACGPPTKEDCKLGGYVDKGYRNQGQCVSASAPGRQ